MERQKMINELFHEHPIPPCPQSILGWDDLGMRPQEQLTVPDFPDGEWSGKKGSMFQVRRPRALAVEQKEAAM